ncbi:hypothetical protein N7509_004170 [Penicillium cosmopolitanum]|uniref:N-acetyltransferase domain-containing protein n=1 Tax=Penicillium cosmopolitanum TaxID=1131564 RepID=A0A9W9W6B3_9EURO|nr:uncharacterized protein N7509_004170 [Penicillium cosmopolitanum]KAJ5404299.1 hypothetical protein N7509_004170 [Penicillium cosmopolitanum]
MAFEVQTASPGDSASLTETFFSTFSDDFNRTMFPANPEVSAFLQNTILEVNTEHQHEILLKVTDPSNAEVVAAFAKWILPIVSADLAAGADANADQDRHEHSAATKWPASSDAKLCDMFFGTMEKHHEEIMDGRPHYYLEILGVHPSYQGRGLASKLLKWGLARADEEGVEVYLSSSPEGKPLYDKNGFEERKYPGRFSPWPGYEQVDMIRTPRK